ncbi:terminase large subunit [Mycobacterium phage SpikeBT]|uniref:Terminase large subunit n=1 Tax=Mycobacterium phage Bruns TaxID=2902905 RepID=G8I5V8_9CAUD|nr:terminase large subunit [Mycobacterium phage Bruns]AJA43494.1 terminase large subunit [Mycobacterium phage Treddle]AVP41774.1 terminase [Mycobacterium phage GageAP]QAY04313.1 terminase large subunit [Mycobacterium phage SpikeBT]QCG76778.1 terminase large subunit [Mycobacterium phage Rutherferd]UIW13338.1 terminase large subunit [Mycobacterium phage Marge]UVD39606.1 terminase large subunit [Mycobacterium phage Kenmech]WAB08970.1 terminase large subunit [Mycobacterium phage Monet]
MQESPEKKLLPAPSHIHGPTWRQYDDGSWYLPEKTLGWGIISWLFEYVGAPDGSGPFIPTMEQARFLAWWYAVDDQGKYLYREGTFRRMKGHGKDPLVAAMALAELCGPVAFSHFDDNGNPVGKTRHAAWITIAAVSQDQTKNTFSLFPIMVSKKLKTEYGLSVNRFIIYSEIGGRLEAATASPASMEGNRPTFVVQNETQWWGVGPGGEVNDGHQMAEVIEGNMTKVDGARTLSICNAHRPGDDTVAEMSYLNWLDILAGDAIDTGVLYDALEAPADTPVSEIPFPSDDPEGYEAGVAQLMKGLEIARGDSIWLPLDDILMSVLTAKNDVIESRRKFLNQVNATEESWIAPSEWDRNHDINLPPLRKGERITLGFDGSLSNDHTALTACRVEDGALFLVKVWVPEKYEGHKVPRQDVDAYVRSMFEKYDVVGMRADVKEFEQSVDAWGQDFRRKLKINASPGNPVAFDMRGQQKRFALDCERFRDAVLAGEVKHDNNPVLKAHITNAHQHPTIYDAISIRKPGKESKRKIDAAVTAVLAWGSRQDFLLSKSNTGKGAGLLR